MLIEERNTVQRLIIEKDDEAEQAKREIENMGQELAYTRKEAQYARNDADIAEVLILLIFPLLYSILNYETIRRMIGDL